MSLSVESIRRAAVVIQNMTPEQRFGRVLERMKERGITIEDLERIAFVVESVPGEN